MIRPPWRAATHPPGGALDAGERAGQIGGHDVPPLFERHVQRRRARSGSCVVHEDVYAAEPTGQRLMVPFSASLP
jgi:hypothetical protein